MEKELRKALRGLLDKVHGADSSLDELMTKENEEILAKYPVKDGAWNHPNSHYLLRIKEFLTISKKTLERVISSLPRERKSKNDKKVVWEDKNNAKESKTGKAPRSSKGDPGTKKRGRKPKVQDGNSGDDNKSTGDGVQQALQRTRKRKSK